MGTKAALEEEWAIVETGIANLIDTIEGVVPESPPIDAGFWMKLYTAVYTMTHGQPSHHSHSKELFERYVGACNDYLTSKALPAIQEKLPNGGDDAGVSLLQEFVKRWANHKVMVSKFCRFLSILDRYYIPQTKFPPLTLKDVGYGCFREIVYDKVKLEVRDSVMALVKREREGIEIDRSLVKDTVQVFVEIGNGNLDYYVNDFETVFLTDLVDYHTRHHGSVGITALECVQKEKDGASYYLDSSTEEKLLEGLDDSKLVEEDPEKAKLIQQLIDERHKRAAQDPEPNKSVKRRPPRVRLSAEESNRLYLLSVKGTKVRNGDVQR